MKHIILSLLVLLLSFLVKAQPKETITEYFDKDWKTITDPGSAAYYRTVEETSGRFIVRDYYISGKLQMMAECSSVTPKLIWEGKKILYYETGIIQEEGMLSNGIYIGLYQSYYKTGKPKKVIIYEKDKGKYIHYWSEEGEELLPNGDGIIVEKNGKQDFQCTEIKDSIAIASFSVMEEDTVYTMMDKLPEYDGGGYETMMRDIGAALKYPKSARRMGIQGVVYVQFQVDKKGVVGNCRVLRGIQAECDAEALNAVCKLSKWRAGIHRQKPVKTRFVLPVKFKLAG